MQYYIYSLFCFLLPGTVWLIWNKAMIADKAYKTRHIIWIYIYMFYGYLAVSGSRRNWNNLGSDYLW